MASGAAAAKLGVGKTQGWWHWSLELKAKHEMRQCRKTTSMGGATGRGMCNGRRTKLPPVRGNMRGMGDGWRGRREGGAAVPAGCKSTFPRNISWAFRFFKLWLARATLSTVLEVY